MEQTVSQYEQPVGVNVWPQKKNRPDNLLALRVHHTTA